MRKEFTKSYAINRIAELNEKIEEMSVEQSETMKFLNKLRDENNQLKYLLEEKDKEIANLIKAKNHYCNCWLNEMKNLSKQIKRKNELYNKLNNKALELKLAVATLNIKIKEKEKEIAYFAIQELKKVKSYFIEECEDEDGFKTGYITLTKDIFEVADYLDERINKLKG